jgi:iron complex outermembrane receptor protein
VTWRDYKRWIFDELALTANFSRIERLPSETERYANWTNAAIRRFIIGTYYNSQPYNLERSNAVEFGAELHKANWSARVNVYRYDFQDFIFLEDSVDFGNFANYVAKDARFLGGEAELTWRMVETDNESVKLTGMVDFVQGENRTDDTYLPRIPPLRIGSRILYERGNLEIGADLRYAFEQDQVQTETASAALEFETDPYFELNLDAQYTWTMRGSDLTVFARVENALDEERRTHASFLKDIAPLPGRGFSMGARWSF